MRLSSLSLKTLSCHVSFPLECAYMPLRTGTCAAHTSQVNGKPIYSRGHTRPWLSLCQNYDLCECLFATV